MREFERLRHLFSVMVRKRAELAIEVGFRCKEPSLVTEIGELNDAFWDALGDFDHHLIDIKWKYGDALMVDGICSNIRELIVRTDNLFEVIGYTFGAVTPEMGMSLKSNDESVAAFYDVMDAFGLKFDEWENSVKEK